MKNEALTNHLYDSFMHCGEILPAADIARKTRELEFDLGVEFDAQTVLASVREAGERFVDSMVQNEHDTEEAVTGGLYCGFPIDTLEARVAKWENMRPSAIRQKRGSHNMKTEVIAASTPRTEIHNGTAQAIRNVTLTDGTKTTVPASSLHFSPCGARLFISIP